MVPVVLAGVVRNEVADVGDHRRVDVGLRWGSVERGRRRLIHRVRRQRIDDLLL